MDFQGQVVKIGAHDVTIQEVEDSDLRSDHIGATANILQNKITLPEEVPATRKLDLFFHEFLHFAFSMSELGDMEERACLQGGEAFAALLKDNKEFFRKLLRAI